MDFGGFDTELMDIRKKEKGISRRYWKYEKGGAFASPFIIHNGILFTASCDCFVYGIRPDTGDIVWRFQTDGPMASMKPEISESVIYFGSNDNFIYAVSLETQKLLWRLRTGDVVDGGPAISDNMIYIGSQDGYLYALDKTRGEELWRFRAGDIIRSKITLYQDRILFGSFDCFLYCLDKITGQEIWRFKTDGNVSNAHEFLIEDGIIFVSSHDGFIYAINIMNGIELWRCKTGPGGGVPSVMGDVFIFGGRDGSVYAINKNNGYELWRCQTDPGRSGFASNKPVITKDSIYIGSSSNKVYAIDFQGRIRWEFSTEGPIWNGTSFHDGMVFAGSQDCKIYAINAETGEEIWRTRSSLSTQPEPEVWDYSPVEVEIQKTEDDSSFDLKEDKYEVDLAGLSSDSEYNAKSEYITKSEYTSTSEYN